MIHKLLHSTLPRPTYSFSLFFSASFCIFFFKFFHVLCFDFIDFRRRRRVLSSYFSLYFLHSQHHLLSPFSLPPLIFVIFGFICFLLIFFLFPLTSHRLLAFPSALLFVFSIASKITFACSCFLLSKFTFRFS